jgi:hypothetical protein
MHRLPRYVFFGEVCKQGRLEQKHLKRSIYSYYRIKNAVKQQTDFRVRKLC